MLRIKLSRRGKKKQPIFRILVIEKQKDPWGDFLENVGTYNPRDKENRLTLKEDRIKHWISVGAQPTPTVHNLLVDAGVISEKKVRGSNLGKKFKEKAEQDLKDSQDKQDKTGQDLKDSQDKQDEPKAEQDGKDSQDNQDSKVEEAPAEKPEEDKSAE